MKKNIATIIKHPFFSGSLIMIIGTNGANALNYIYHMLMGRLLGPSEYGVLAALLSLLGIITIIPQSFSLVIVKFVSSSKNLEEVKSLYKYLNIRVYLLGFLLSVIVFIFSKQVSSFLNITNIYLLYLVAGSIFFIIPASYYRSVLQGLLKFGSSVISIFADTAVKLFLGLLFVFLGFKVFGAILGIVLAMIVGWILAYIFLKDLRKNSSAVSKFNIKPILLYSIPVFFQFITLTSFYSSDLLLVKHFFTSYDAGIYASVSSLGKIIFFATAPISSVMFPIISKRYSRNQKFLKIFFASILATLVASVTVLFFYWLFPTYSIFLLYGKAYTSGANLLLPYGIFIMVLSLSWVIVNFTLSLGKTKTVIIPCIAAILQIVIILFFHTSLLEIIVVSLIVSLLMLIALSLALIPVIRK